MNSELFKLDIFDVVKGLAVTIFAAVITVLYGVVSQADFDLFTANWGLILGDVLQVSLTSLLAYLMKNFVSSEEGAIFGIKRND